MRRGGEAAALLPLYAAALFASALLAFWIQPLFTKLVLPRYGGSPAVWTTAAMFFQVVLLAGYLYAHVLTRYRLRAQLAVHAVLIAAAVATLPLHAAGVMPAGTAPVVSLLALLASSVGLPYFAVSATAPLLQQWFSRTRHVDARDPYFLYSASNAGSLAALVGYPLALEPLLGLGTQSLAWSVAYGAFAAVLVVCGLAARRHAGEQTGVGPRSASDPARAAGSDPGFVAGWRDRIRWMLLAFAPSSLMLGVTQHITSEIAAAPLLWLIPLTIYVLTFVIAFARRQVVSLRLVERIQPIAVIVLVLAWPLNNQKSVLGLHLAVFAITAMMCHAELARRRPAVAQLTEFYLCLSIGGAAGGVFNAIVAPLVFHSILEYPIALAVACALRNVVRSPRKPVIEGVALVALAAILAALLATGVQPFAHGAFAVVLYLQAVGVLLYVTSGRPALFAGAVLVTVLLTPHIHSSEKILERHRSFFGVHTVVRDESAKFNVLMHGITIHGAQWLDPKKRTTPITYFHADSGIAQIFRVLGADVKRVAVLGMGAGTLACYRAPGRAFTFYEIDPVVVQLARDTRYFTYLSECAPHAKIGIGDGRLSIAGDADGSYDLIVVDTFSSDSVPVHMITREALAIYLSKLAPNGIVVFQVTNQFMDFVPILSRLAADAGVTGVMPGPQLEIQFDERLAALPSRWVAISRDPHRFDALMEKESWKPLPTVAGRPWTDDYSNVLGALK
ncbi:MAG TPA: fused MFS/spermidine synthase [Burkholderiales bacterium]|nr:fused MFS/spermidine synthase [Burkholderiales bacterium]